ncbi:MAG TPA: carbohydrate porin, partial [Rhodanobacter sp.]
MRSKLIAVAIATGLGVTSFTVAAAPAQNRASSPTSNAEVELLKAQLATLQAKVEELEQRTDAQSDINVSTG